MGVNDHSQNNIKLSFTYSGGIYNNQKVNWYYCATYAKVKLTSMQSLCGYNALYSNLLH